MLKFVFSLLLVPFSFAQAADLNGNWTGQGSAQDNRSWKAECQQMEMQIRQTETELHLISHSFRCRGFRFYHDVPIVLSIRGGQVFNGEIAIGEIDERGAYIRFADNQGHMSWVKFAFTASGGLDFSQHMRFADGYYIETSGAFTKQ